MLTSYSRIQNSILSVNNLYKYINKQNIVIRSDIFNLKTKDKYVVIAKKL